MDRKDGKQSRDEDAADRTDDGSRRFDVASVDDELSRERDDGADENGPKENVRRREEDECDESLCNEQDGEEENEECLCTRHAAKAYEEDGKAEGQSKHRRQTVIVNDGVAAVFIAHDEVVTFLRVDVKGGIVQRPMCDRRLCALRRSRIDMELYHVLFAARCKCRDLVLRFGDA